MRRAIIVALAVGGIAVAGMLWLLATRKTPPPIPIDRAHVSSPGEQDCVACHGPDGAAPRTKNHPLSDRCFQCHLWSPGR